MKLQKILICAVTMSSLFLLYTGTAYAKECTPLSRNLKQGISGEDVRNLQVLLNSDTRTKIADSGFGSAGYESTYFGGKTKLAVIKFQELYKNEVLTPAGLLRGNGFVGSLSRAKFSALCSKINGKTTQTQPTTNTSPTPTTPPTTQSTIGTPLLTQLASPMVSNNIKPYLMFPNKYAVHQGEMLVISGGGFTPTDNTVMIGSTKYTGITPTKNKSLDVKIPTDAMKGEFELSFFNSKGQSNKTFIIITDPRAVAPKVTSFTPTMGTIGTQITVKGERFSSEWNTIIVGAKKIKGVVSQDGTTLTFVATLPIPGVSSGQDVANVDIKAPLWFYIANPNGISNGSEFKLRI